MVSIELDSKAIGLLRDKIEGWALDGPGKIYISPPYNAAKHQTWKRIYNKRFVCLLQFP